MAINIRNKGQTGEREVCSLLVAYGLVSEASRNLDQVREGGSDVEALAKVSIEVKRHEKIAIKSWWDQVGKSATNVGKIPCVMWRPNSHKWLCMLPAGCIPGNQVQVNTKVGRVPDYGKYPHIQFVDLEVFMAWYKKTFMVYEVA